MNTTMEITLKFTENAFIATACILCDTSIDEKELSFIINNDLNITEVICNENLIEYEICEKVQPQFRPLSKRIVIKNQDTIRNVTIKYSGTVAYSEEKQSCWHNIITNEIKSLSMYSVWYPQEMSIQINHDKVILLDGNKYFFGKRYF